jgi:hypothetical protein
MSNGDALMNLFALVVIIVLIGMMAWKAWRLQVLTLACA